MSGDCCGIKNEVSSIYASSVHNKVATISTAAVTDKSQPRISSASCETMAPCFVLFHVFVSYVLLATNVGVLATAPKEK